MLFFRIVLWFLKNLAYKYDSIPTGRHCEQSEAIQKATKRLDCFGAKLLAMTTGVKRHYFKVTPLVSLLLLCCCITGCGFHPLYMPIKGSSHVAVPIKIATIQNRDGQILRNYLVDLLTPEGAPQHPEYILEISLTDVIAAIGVNKDETASRKNATVTARLTLKDPQTNRILYTHTTNAINSFSVISQNYFSDLTAEDYAKKEALRLLAEKISLLVITYIDSKNES